MTYIVFSSHALVRMGERHIKKRDIIETVRNPEITFQTRHRRRRRVMKNLQGRTIDVIIEEKEKYILVITCAVLTRKEV